MFDYNIWSENDNKIFDDVCKILSESLVGFEKQRILIDVDGSHDPNIKKRQ